MERGVFNSSENLYYFPRTHSKLIGRLHSTKNIRAIFKRNEELHVLYKQLSSKDLQKEYFTVAIRKNKGYKVFAFKVQGISKFFNKNTTVQIWNDLIRKGWRKSP
jgi:hypothetical protein